MTPKSYVDNFFSAHYQNSIDSAKEVIPLVKTYISPNTVIDIGCGIGTWLSVWKAGGSTILGVDGSYVDKKELLISEHEFIATDLDNGFKSDKKFDLATCLEVAEHIKPQHASLFVSSLCKLADVVVFSAAIPGQEGTFHFNEQYPDYWADQFRKNGFSPYDILRTQVWNNEKISWWYRQNIMFYVKDEVKDSYPGITSHPSKVLSIVHPDLFNYKCQRVEGYEKLLSNPFQATKYFAGKYLRSIKSAFKK